MFNFDFDELDVQPIKDECLEKLKQRVAASAASTDVADGDAANPQDEESDLPTAQEFSSPRIPRVLRNSSRLKTVHVVRLSNTNGNFRDIGGLASKDGRMVRYGRIFRHGQLSSLTESGLKQFQELGLKANVDFRTRSESSKSPQKCFHSSTQIFRIPVSGGEHKLNLSEAVSKVDFSEIKSSLQCVKPAIYGRFVTENLAEFQRFAEVVLDFNNYPLSFNCTAGNDRSGWAAAIVYMLLDVPRESIIEDYAISTVLLSEWIRRITEQMHKHFNDNHPGMKIDMDPIWRLLSVDPEWIKAGFAAIEETWGSVDAYLEDGLGVTRQQRQGFQERLLESDS